MLYMYSVCVIIYANKDYYYYYFKTFTSVNDTYIEFTLGGNFHRHSLLITFDIVYTVVGQKSTIMTNYYYQS